MSDAPGGLIQRASNAQQRERGGIGQEPQPVVASSHSHQRPTTSSEKIDLRCARSRPARHQLSDHAHGQTRTCCPGAHRTADCCSSSTDSLIKSYKPESQQRAERQQRQQRQQRETAERDSRDSRDSREREQSRALSSLSLSLTVALPPPLLHRACLECLECLECPLTRKRVPCISSQHKGTTKGTQPKAGARRASTAHPYLKYIVIVIVIVFLS